MYNLELEGTRLISVDIWDDVSQKYQPLEPVKLYTFAMDSYDCSVYEPVASNSYESPGEQRGIIGPELIQNVMASYLANLTMPYNNSIEGRLVNDVIAMNAWKLATGPNDCVKGQGWVDRLQACIECAEISNVAFSDKRIDFSLVG